MIRIINSIARELNSVYPTLPIYIQKVPTDFIRPSFFVQLVSNSTSELNKTMRRDDISIQVIYFSNIDDYKIVDVESQLNEVEKIKAPFKTGAIKIEGLNKYAKIDSIRLNKRDEGIFLDLDLYVIDLEPLVDNVVYDIMQNVNFREE